MPSEPTISLDEMVDRLKAAAESSRLRILLLLAHGDLTVSDVTEILNQSQPRVSRHLKLLLDARLIERYQEGSWAYFRLSDDETARGFVQGLVSRVEPGDPVAARDAERLANVKRRRAGRAAEYFSANAASWDRIRSLHVPDAAVEAAMLELVGPRPFQAMADLGTGTGRMLELFAPLYRRGVGVDLSREMLAVARARLEAADLLRRVQVRQGDLAQLPLPDAGFDVALMHHVLHHVETPEEALAEAARVLVPGGLLIVVDFLPHAVEALRRDHAHRWPGFAPGQMAGWLKRAGLVPATPLSLPGRALTVAVWEARRPGGQRAMTAPLSAHEATR